ncbi:MAG: bifunctional 3,4-dihydroxy-2-butanone-4-phosphate synthase/GTP cyclohydrolase II [Burkholderiales bacterium]
MFNSIPEAIADLKQGKLIIICDDEGRENEGDFVALAESITPETINFMITHGKGLVCMPIIQGYADKLQLKAMVDDNTEKQKTAFTISVDHNSNNTGISALDRATTIKKVLDPNAIATNFRRPGHIFPLIAKPYGVLERAGHTEAAVDLARLCGSKPAGVICEIINPDGTMARRNDLMQLAKKFKLKIITIKDLVNYRKICDNLITREAEADLPTLFGKFTMVGYSNIADHKEHVAVVKGDPTTVAAPLVRIHSECFTGDVFHSLRCDCGEQLEKALAAIESEGVGVIIYLRQEGRGIGLINKLRAYKLQQEGFDTVEANLELGFADDAREYFIAAQMLKDLGVFKARLITNNPDKIRAMEDYGVMVEERVIKSSTTYPENQRYLATKISKFGHLL